MEDSRYLQCLAADYGDLRDAASAAELTANVPTGRRCLALDVGPGR